MNVMIKENGILLLEAEDETESYAIKKWLADNPCPNILYNPHEEKRNIETGYSQRTAIYQA